MHCNTLDCQDPMTLLHFDKDSNACNGYTINKVDITTVALGSDKHKGYFSLPLNPVGGTVITITFNKKHPQDLQHSIALALPQA